MSGEQAHPGQAWREAARIEFSALLADEVATWHAPQAGVAVVDADGTVGSTGPLDVPLPWASVTKVVSALAVLQVVEQGRLSLDEAAGPDGSTVRHLLSHASGLAFDEDRVMAAPGTRRLYSNVGIDLAVALAVERSGLPDPSTLLREMVFGPLGMNGSHLAGPPSRGGVGPVRDLASLARELIAPRVLPVALVGSARTVHFPGLAGVVPGFGRHDPSDWGLGPEIRGAKSPHWTPPGASPGTFGHFGQAGAFLWVDPEAALAMVCATGRDFGPWAAEGWPRLGQAVLDRWT